MVVIYHADESRIAPRVNLNKVNSSSEQGLYTVCASANTLPGTTPESYGNINSGGAPFPGTSNVTTLSDVTVPALHSNDGKYSYAALNDIAENNGRISFSFVKGDEPEGVGNLVAAAKQGVVTLTWERPTTGSVRNYRVFRNNELVAQPTTESYVDRSLTATQAEYKVDVVYTDGLYSSFVHKTVRVPENRIEELEGNSLYGETVLQWSLNPLLTRSSITIGNENVSFHTLDGAEVDVAQRFNAADLKIYVGYRFDRFCGQLGGYLGGSGSSLIDGRKATATTTWKTGTIETDGGVENMAIQFYADADIFLDDIKVEQMGVVEPVEPVEPTLDAPSALAASDITSTGFVANWEVTSGATGYLLDVYYYENNEPQYLLKDEAVAATSYAVTGAQEGKVYYYTVRATDGTLVSEPSNEVLAKAASTSIGSVTALPATEVSDAGFRANWTAAENAAFYELTTLLLYTVPASGTFTHDNETFDRVTEGTESSPVYGAIQGALNDYTEYADWYAITPVMANGKIGLKNYYMIMGYYSMLYTPIYFVESNTASTVTISMDVKRVDCSAATEVGVCLVNAATEEAGE